MTMIGSFGEALLRAIGAVADRPVDIRLRGVADDALKRHDGNLKKAGEAVERAVRDDPALLLALLDEARFVGGVCNRYVERRAKALREASVSLPGQFRSDAHRCTARQGQDATNGAGRGIGGAHVDPARPIETRGGHTNCDAQQSAAPAPETPAGQAPPDAHVAPARRDKNGDGANESAAPNATLPRRRPGNAKRTGFTAMKRVRDAASRSVLDLIRVNGQPLREVTAGEALRWAEKQAQDAATVQRVCTGLKDEKPIGEQITDAEAEARAKVS